MLVSFDYDRTITDHAYELSQIASALSANGHRTMVITGRRSANDIADFLHNNGFPEMDIITNEDKISSRAFKEKVLRENGVDMHWDDDDLNLPAYHPTKVVSFSENRLQFGFYKGGG